MTKTYYISVGNDNGVKVYKIKATKRSIAEQKVLKEACKHFTNPTIFHVISEVNGKKLLTN